MLLFLVIAPPLEERYGSRTLLSGILMAALVSGILQCVLFPSSALLGASGIVFMLIMLSSLAGSRNGGIPAALSYTAGSFVCNSLMYTLLYLIDRQYPAMRGGFIHVPYAMEQAVSKPLGTPSMELHQIARGLALAVEAVVENERDLTVNR